MKKSYKVEGPNKEAFYHGNNIEKAKAEVFRSYDLGIKLFEITNRDETEVSELIPEWLEEKENS